MSKIKKSDSLFIYKRIYNRKQLNVQADKKYTLCLYLKF